jgi:hypothetical protein
MIDATLPKLGKRGPYKTAEKGWNPYDVSLKCTPAGASRRKSYDAAMAEADLLVAKIAAELQCDLDALRAQSVR